MKLRIGLIGILILPLVSSCMSALLPPTVETVKALLLKEDTNTLYLVGETYHYEFQIDDTEISGLKMRKEIGAIPIFIGFKAYGSEVDGMLLVWVLRSEVDVHRQIQLEALGYRLEGEGEATILQLSVALKGIRFNPIQEVDDAITEPEKFYFVVGETASPAHRATNALVSVPLGVVLGTAIVVTGVVETLCCKNDYLVVQYNLPEIAAEANEYAAVSLRFIGSETQISKSPEIIQYASPYTLEIKVSPNKQLGVSVRAIENFEITSGEGASLFKFSDDEMKIGAYLVQPPETYLWNSPYRALALEHSPLVVSFTLVLDVEQGELQIPIRREFEAEYIEHEVDVDRFDDIFGIKALLSI